jgi:hypothetical protein
VRVSEFRHIGKRESGIQVTRHCECRIHDRGNPDRKRSALTGSRVSGFERPTLDHWIHEVASFDLPSVKRRSHEIVVGAEFPIGN